MNELRNNMSGSPHPGNPHNTHFRPIRPDDWRHLQKFHKRLSPNTVGLRFHGAKKELSEPLAHRFTQLDGKNEVGIVATTGTRGRIIGVARYSRVSPTCAEVAFVIEDAFQHHGVGHRLMVWLRQIALENGIKEFVAEVMPGNVAMLRLLREAGPTEVRTSQGESEARVRLQA
jgi:RimJ/RimL family protein N-acetyltransferase